MKAIFSVLCLFRLLSCGCAKNSWKLILGLSLCIGTVVQSRADALDTWSTNRVVFNNFELTDIVCGNGQYVSVGQYVGVDAGQIFSSDNGLNWTPSNYNYPTYELYGVAYGAGTFVAVGFYGSIYSSTNGMDWISGQSPVPIYSLLDVTFGNGTFVAVGAPDLMTGGDTTSNILTSVDGINWTAHPSCGFTNGVQAINAVAYGGGYFVAVGDGGFFYISHDGASWTRYNSGAGQSYSSVVYGLGRFIASCGSSTNLIVSDFQGIQPWYLQDSGTTANFGKLAFANGLFIGSGYSTTLGTNVFLTSTDGTNWLQHSFYHGDTITGMLFDGTKFMALATSPSFFDTSHLLYSDPLVSLGLNFNGSPQLNLSGAVGLSYRIDYMNQLPINASNTWQPLTNFTLTNSPCILTDTQTSNTQSRFYRAVLLP